MYELFTLTPAFSDDDNFFKNINEGLFKQDMLE